MKKFGLILFLSVLTINLLAQEKEIDRFSFTIAWTPAYYGPNNGDFRIDAILPFSFESLIYFKPWKKFSFSSGFGYWRHDWTMNSWWWLSTIDAGKSQRDIYNTIQIPLQIHYYLFKSTKNADVYFKTAFINEFMFSKTIYYEYDIIDHTDSDRFYTPSIALGIGSMFRKNKAVGILIEGSMGTYLDLDLFEMYILRIKFGVVLN